MDSGERVGRKTCAGDEPCLVRVRAATTAAKTASGEGASQRCRAARVGGACASYIRCRVHMGARVSETK